MFSRVLRLPGCLAFLLAGPSAAYDVFTAPVSGVYTITAAGAEGGTGALGQVPNYPVTAGAGAFVTGDIYLAGGAVLYIVPGFIGGSEPYSAGGGGGGSFVFASLTSPLLIAGGGGGSNYCFHDCTLGGPGIFGAAGSGFGGAAGVSAYGGDGAGGGGWLGNGSAPPLLFDAYFGDQLYDTLEGGDGPPSFAGGGSYLVGSEPYDGSAAGGKGGGGAGGYNGGGGGGGYTGGDGGSVDFKHLSTGGTSYVAQSVTHVTGVSGENYGFGYVDVQHGSSISIFDSVPEPAVWVLMLIGLGGLGASIRGQRGREAAV